MDLVTVLVPTYNRPGALVKAILSIQAQTYKNLKIIVSDNAGSDKTPGIMREIAAGDSRISYIRHEHTLPRIDHFLFLFDQVKTPYFALLCDDDLLLPNFLEDALLGFSKHPEILYSALFTVAVNEDHELVSTDEKFKLESGYYTVEQAVRYFVIENYVHHGTPATLYSKKTIKLIHDNRSLCTGPYFCDMFFSFILMSSGPIYFSSKPGGIFFFNDTSQSVTSDVSLIYPNWIDKLTDLYQLVARYNGLKASVCSRLERIYNKRLFANGVRALLEKDIDKYNNVTFAFNSMYGRLKYSYILKGLKTIEYIFPGTVETLFKIKSFYKKYLLRKKSDNKKRDLVEQDVSAFLKL